MSQYTPEDLPTTPLPPSPFAQREFVSPAAASSPPPKPPVPLAPGLRAAASMADVEAECLRARAVSYRQMAEESDRAAAVLRGMATRYRREAAAEESAS